MFFFHYKDKTICSDEVDFLTIWNFNLTLYWRMRLEALFKNLHKDHNTTSKIDIKIVPYWQYLFSIITDWNSDSHQLKCQGNSLIESLSLTSWNQFDREMSKKINDCVYNSRIHLQCKCHFAMHIQHKLPWTFHSISASINSYSIRIN